MNVVLDTNVLLSGLMLPNSIPGKIINAWQNACYDLVLSEPMLSEFAKVLAYPKIKKRLKWNPHKIEQFVLMLRFKTVIPDISSTDVQVPKDPDDSIILATFLAGKAEYLVTGDSDLLELKNQYHTIETPTEFARRLS